MLNKKSVQDRLRMYSPQAHSPQLLMEAADRIDTLEAQVIELRNAMFVMEAFRRDTGK